MLTRTLLILLAVTAIGLEAQRVTRKPGRCPRAPRIPNRACNKDACSTDSDCSGDNKCCGCIRKCVPPRDDAPSCPKLKRNFPDTCVPSANVCSKNSDCGRRRICCAFPDNCGSSKCVRGRKVRPRRCPRKPAALPEICTRALPSFACETDADCRKNEKCCPGVCGGTGCFKKGGEAPLG